MGKKIVAFLFILAFLFIRFYRINSSLFFFNDMGRDLLVLYEWQNFGKIPLIGPQTSALPVNQSPVYYFFLMPFYLLFNHSQYSALIANAVLYLACFLFGLYLTKDNKLLSRGVFVAFLLFVFHPQHVLQNRFVWNPSLIPPILLLSLVLFFLFDEKGKLMYLFSSFALLSAAISLNYSVFPLLLIYFLILFLRKLAISFWRWLVIAGVLVFFNMTAVLQLAKRFISTGAFFQSSQVFQISSSFGQKICDFLGLVLGTRADIFSYIFLGVVILLGLYLSFFATTKTVKLGAGIFIGTTILTLLMPFKLHAHYIFAITTSLFIFLGLLNWKISLPMILFLLFYYGQPMQILGYFKPAPRTYEQMDWCFKQFCSNFKEPVFVSVQSNLYPYHFGPEHRYLMIKNGCNVKSIEKDAKAAKFMAVVLDSGSFSDQTRYYELELFGKYKQIETQNCQPNFGIVLLEK